MKQKKTFDKLYASIETLTRKDSADSSLVFCKLTEEVGELAKAINKLNGRKKLSRKDNITSITEEILFESADVIQNTICILCKLGFKQEDLLQALNIKNKKWEDCFKKK